MPRERLPKVRAILFDLSGTLTNHSRGILDVHRETAVSAGFDMSQITEAQLKETHESMDVHFKKYISENDVGIHWGEDPEDWLELNRLFMESLGFTDVSDEQLREMEGYWKETLASNWELMIEGARETLEELQRRGYILGICTRRDNNPEQLLKDWGIHQLISTIQYSMVPGYAKPSPFTLLIAADEIRINPRFCAYVGNLVNADVEASTRAEMLPILTVWADKKEKDHAPDDIIVIDKIGELLEIFTGPLN
ncbi:MAG: HAD family hydrolase [Candidatus Thorarchaeota archaeon]|jgi:phosphoglycolate phosphatase-like HAD superfamily hydrolase